jgi:hypothetical protein
MALVKNNIDIIITNIILGIKEEMVRPYNDEISNCFLFGLISSNVILRIIIAKIKPKVKTQNRMFMVVLMNGEKRSVAIDCNQ